MKNETLADNKNLQQVHVSRPPTTVRTVQQGIGDAPSVEDVAQRAYFLYQSQGSVHGHDVRHWLEAETQLIEERTSLYVGSHIMTD